MGIIDEYQSAQEKIESVIPDPDPLNKNHYINAKEFSKEIERYLKRRNKNIEEGLTIPRIPDNIGIQFMRIATRLARRPNFNRYTYIDEMILDGIEDCIKGIKNYNSQYGSAFSYFTTIIYWAFVRRIKRENKERDLKKKLLEESLPSDFFSTIGISIYQQYNEMPKSMKDPSIDTPEDNEEESTSENLQIDFDQVAKKYFENGQSISDDTSFSNESIYTIHQDFYRKIS